jgi:leader peptidase (prepilin peptidase)/N-methyltransferase
VILCGAIGIYTHGFWMTLAGGAVGFGSMYLLYILGVFYARWMAKRRGEETSEEGMGFGDVSLSGVLGLVLGFPGIVAGLVTAILAGGVFSLVFFIILKILKKYSLFASIPYAPFLVLGTAGLLFLK